ncbi:MAG: ATP-binding protein [Elusimicrobiota bacterium]|jgi:predicted AAA+ superfamily ATPase|nr:ATP-binding protein [Elusimicrobiota bacterium]
MYLKRGIEKQIAASIKNFPVTAITGPRQCGKSTLAKHLMQEFKNTIYLDLERPRDLAKLNDAELFLTANKNSLICIDEIQRKPEIFPLIRSLVDEWDRNGCFIILGSASRDLLKQSSETLAGRISYKRLTPFLFDELNNISIEKYISCGAFPKSILSKSYETSFEWRENFITTFLERDLLQWQYFTPTTMQKLWKMLAFTNGQTANYSQLAGSLGISDTSVKNYIDLLSSAYMIEVTPPYFSNLGKRLVKAPKIYISDAGITAALLNVSSFSQLAGHPSIGAIWESVVLANIKGWYPNAQVYHYRTSSQSEMDFVIEIKGKIFAVECKASHSPILSKGSYFAIEDIKPLKTFVAIPFEDNWNIKENIKVVSLTNLKKEFAQALSADL